MDKPEIEQIASLLNDVQEDLCEGDSDGLHLHLTELYRLIQRLMEATFATEDEGVKVVLANLERMARQYKREIEERLGVRN